MVWHGYTVQSREAECFFLSLQVESSTAATQACIHEMLNVVDTFLSSEVAANTTRTNGSQAQAQFIQEFSPIVAALRAEYRALSDAAREGKNTVGSERAAVDEKLVKLHNLEYQQAKLEGEIRSTKDLRSIYQDVDMPSEAEFRQTAPPALRSPDILDDEHKLMVSRLEHELAERQRLDTERRALARQKLGLLTVDRSKATRLKALEKAVRDILEQAVALRDAGSQEDQQ
ncbi:hypothetical protein V8E36_004152 [Tilletia maclaganii]